MSDLLKKGDRVTMIYRNEFTGEEQIFSGTVQRDEIEFWHLIDVQWDNHPQASLFPVSRFALFRVDDATAD